MSSQWLPVLAVGPLAIYFLMMAVWHGGRHPTVVSGLADFALLAFGVGGMFAFGPIGQTIMAAVFGRPDWLDVTAFLSTLGLVAVVFARRSLRRTVIYHIEPALLDAELVGVLRGTGRDFRRTLTGYEEPAEGRWLAVETSGWLKAAVLEVHGNRAEQLNQELRARLRPRLARVDSGDSRVSPLFFAAAACVIAVPLLARGLAQPGPRAVLRAFLDRIVGG